MVFYFFKGVLYKFLNCREFVVNFRKDILEAMFLVVLFLGLLVVRVACALEFCVRCLVEREFVKIY